VASSGSRNARQSKPAPRIRTWRIPAATASRTPSSMKRVRTRTLSRKNGALAKRSSTSAAASPPRNRCANGSSNRRSRFGFDASSSRTRAIVAAVSVTVAMHGSVEGRIASVTSGKTYAAAISARYDGKTVPGDAHDVRTEEGCVVRNVRLARAVGLLALILLAASPIDGVAEPRDPALVSLYQGNQFVSDSDSAAISADGRWVAFVTRYKARDVFLYDRATGDTIYVTEGADGDSANPAISADGRYVAFETVAGNLVPDDSSWSPDVLVYDRVNATFARATVASDGTPADNGGTDPAISADGRWVAFASQSTNLSAQDPYGTSDVYVRDMVGGTTVLASSRRRRLPRKDASYEPAISATARRSRSRPTRRSTSADTIECRGELFVESWPDVYVKDLATGALERVSVGRRRRKRREPARRRCRPTGAWSHSPRPRAISSPTTRTASPTSSCAIGARAPPSASRSRPTDRRRRCKRRSRVLARRSLRRISPRRRRTSRTATATAQPTCSSVTGSRRPPRACP
jgi:hypothetical protein